MCGMGWSRSGPRWERGGVVDRARLAGGCSSRRQRGRAAAIVEGGGRGWGSAGSAGSAAAMESAEEELWRGVEAAGLGLRRGLTNQARSGSNSIHPALWPRGAQFSTVKIYKYMQSPRSVALLQCPQHEYYIKKRGKKKKEKKREPKRLEPLCSLVAPRSPPLRILF